MHPRPTPTSPSLTRDFVLLNEPVKMPHPPTTPIIPNSSSFPHRIKAIKNRKFVEDPIPEFEAMDLDDFKFDKVVLRDDMVLDTLVTYFDEGIFG